MATMKRLGILAALPQEVAKLKKAVDGQEEHPRGSAFTFITGTLVGTPVVFAAANVRECNKTLRLFTLVNESCATASGYMHPASVWRDRWAWSLPRAQRRP